MSTSRRLAGALLAALTMAFATTQLASAQDADSQAVLRYTLTDAGLAKYAAATQKLSALPGADRCDSQDDEGDDDSDSSLSGMVARLDATPGAKAAIQSAGMTTREYVVFSWSILHNSLAAWAVSQPGGKLPPGVSQANVDFLKKNEAKLKQLEGLTESDCPDEAAEDEPEE